MSKIYTIEEIKKISVPVAQRYGVEKLALFGSYARGEQTKQSDVDFLIKLGSMRGFEFYGFWNELEDELSLPVDIVTYMTLENSLIADAIEDEVVLYER